VGEAEFVANNERVVRKAGRVRRWLPVHERWWELDLLRILVRRDLEARYKGVLGNFWPLLNQLSQLLIYTHIFDCFKGEAESKGLPANDLTLVFGSLPGCCLGRHLSGGF